MISLTASRLLHSCLSLLAFAVLLAACSPLAPAAERPHLSHTPGAFVVVTDGRLDAGIFKLEYPPSWRVVKASPAVESLLRITLVAPDGGIVSLSQLAADAEASARALRLDSGILIQVLIEPGDQPAASFRASAEGIVSSIRS